MGFMGMSANTVGVYFHVRPVPRNADIVLYGKGAGNGTGEPGGKQR